MLKALGREFFLKRDIHCTNDNGNEPKPPCLRCYSQQNTLALITHIFRANSYFLKASSFYDNFICPPLINLYYRCRPLDHQLLVYVHSSVASMLPRLAGAYLLHKVFIFFSASSLYEDPNMA